MAPGLAGVVPYGPVGEPYGTCGTMPGSSTPDGEPSQRHLNSLVSGGRSAAGAHAATAGIGPVRNVHAADGHARCPVAVVAHA